MAEEYDANEEISKINAKLIALEFLCLSIFKHHPNRKSVLEDFLDKKERAVSKALYDRTLDDPGPALIQAELDHFVHVLQAESAP